MPWLGDGTWVQDAGLARAIINGRTTYRPWSGDTGGAMKAPSNLPPGVTDSMIEEQANAACYAWICTEDHVTDDDDHRTGLPTRVGWEGPRDAPDYLLERLRAGEGHEWRCYDDDGELYYAGRYLDTEDSEPSISTGPGSSPERPCISGMDEMAFGPLDDLARPDAGAVRIDYLVKYPTPKVRVTYEHGKWAPL